jgi:hypothetical protein
MEKISLNEIVKSGAKLYKDLDDMVISLKQFNLEMKLLFDQSGLKDFEYFDMLCYDRSF